MVKTNRYAYSTTTDAVMGIIEQIKKFNKKYDVTPDIDPGSIAMLVSSVGMFGLYNAEAKKLIVPSDMAYPRDCLIKFDFSSPGHKLSEINVLYQSYLPSAEKLVHYVDPFHPVVTVSWENETFECCYYCMDLPHQGGEENA